MRSGRQSFLVWDGKDVSIWQAVYKTNAEPTYIMHVKCMESNRANKEVGWNAYSTM